jgi:hypothetical protein
MEVAEEREERSRPFRGPLGRLLVERRRVGEEQGGQDEARRRGRPEESRIGPGLFLGNIMRHEQGKNPENRDEGPGLRRVPGALREERGDQDVRRRDEEEPEEGLSFPARGLDESEGGEQPDRGVEKQPVLLVQKISGQGFGAEAERDVREQRFEITPGFAAAEASLPGDGG